MTDHTKIDLPFEVVSNRPLVLEITRDGKVYEARVMLSISHVWDTGGTNQDGTPRLEFRATTTVDVTGPRDAE